MSLRHVTKLEGLMSQIQSDRDKLNDKYSSGFVEGFTKEFLGKSNQLRLATFGLIPGWKGIWSC